MQTTVLRIYYSIFIRTRQYKQHIDHIIHIIKAPLRFE